MVNYFEDALKNFNYDCGLIKVTWEQITKAEKQCNVLFGPYFTYYLESYGYLGCNHIEFCGLYGQEVRQCDLVRMTQALHAKYTWASHLICLERISTDEWICVDTEDNVYQCLTGKSKPILLDDNVLHYIITKFKETGENSSET